MVACRVQLCVVCCQQRSRRSTYGLMSPVLALLLEGFPVRLEFCAEETTLLGLVQRQEQRLKSSYDYLGDKCFTGRFFLSLVPLEGWNAFGFQWNMKKPVNTNTS